MAVIRQGRRLGEVGGLQTLYLQEGPEPADTDPCVGMVISRDLARIIVRAVNAGGFLDSRLARPG